ncbi:MAG: DUF3127 domain-containing protein [Bacteroidia bacterium]|nr:DUF3127 domain-containing protein [Bacteroidia bacterium]
MSFKTTGKVLQVLPEITGTSARGEWKKQDFVIETGEDQYPKKICFTLFNDKNGTFEKVKPGMEVEVSFSIESREYNEKWFSNINAFRVDLAPQGGSPANTPPSGQEFTSTPLSVDLDDKDDLPF